MVAGLLIECCVSKYYIYPNLNHSLKKFQNNQIVVSLQHAAAPLTMCLFPPSLIDPGYRDHPPLFFLKGDDLLKSERGVSCWPVVFGILLF